MAFSDFKTIPDVQKKFGIRHIENDFIKIKEDISPSEQFLQELEFIVYPENKFTFSEVYVSLYDYGIFNRFTQTRA